ncbi:hypothetical protein EPUL_001786, partial [Erysiphe pulchra]
IEAFLKAGLNQKKIVTSLGILRIQVGYFLRRGNMIPKKARGGELSFNSDDFNKIESFVKLSPVNRRISYLELALGRALEIFRSECIYSRLWLRQDRLNFSNNATIASATTSGFSRPISTSSNLPSGVAGAGGVTATSTATAAITATSNNQLLVAPSNIAAANGHSHYDHLRNRNSRLSAKDDAKLIFGTIYSLRNIVRKLGGLDDSFISYRTAQYKLHYYETPTNVKFVILTDIGTLNMRNVLHQIYVNLYVEYVIKNPLSPIEHKGGKGVANELFELALDQFVKGLL